MAGGNYSAIILLHRLRLLFLLRLFRLCFFPSFSSLFASFPSFFFLPLHLLHASSFVLLLGSPVSESLVKCGSAAERLGFFVCLFSLKDLTLLAALLSVSSHLIAACLIFFFFPFPPWLFWIHFVLPPHPHLLPHPRPRGHTVFPPPPPKSCHQLALRESSHLRTKVLWV